MFDPLVTLDHDATLDTPRIAIRNAAERLSRFAGIVVELIEMREDDRAQGMRGACADQVAILNREFQALGRELKRQREDRVRDHFADVGTKQHRETEERRQERLQEDAEADAAAVR